MPVLANSSYQPPNFLFRNRHLNTIYSSVFRKVNVDYERETIDTPDGDFLDLDWSKVGSDKVMIAFHGLEGNAERSSIKAFVKKFNEGGWDGIGFNFRGCSGRPNKKLYSYHMGATYDVENVVQHVLKKGYQKIALVGYSMGGNVILKYLGEKGEKVNPAIQKAVTFSVPCDIPSANIEIDKPHNFIYIKRFLRSLNAKIKEKESRFPELLKMRPAHTPKNFTEFDNAYTAPINGFDDAMDYWKQCSSGLGLMNIRVPSLLVNAKDDSFLSAACFPYKVAEQNPCFFLETPQFGGHFGFTSFHPSRHYWPEERAWSFVAEND